MASFEMLQSGTTVELVDTLDRLQAVLVSRATGTGCDPNEYQQLRTTVMEDPLVGHLVPRWLRNNRTSDEYWQFIKYERDGYVARRQFIWAELRPLFDRAEGSVSTPADAPIANTLARFDTEAVHALWTKAMERRDSDPEGAITVARTLLEEVCKHILDDLSIAYDAKDDLSFLYRATSSALNLSPSQHTEHAFKQILGGAANVVHGLGTLRNAHSDAHGHGKAAVKPLPRHAGYAVNLAGATALFLVETHQARIVSQGELLQRPENIARLTSAPATELSSYGTPHT